MPRTLLFLVLIIPTIAASQDIPYRVAETPWPNVDQRGFHRALIEVPTAAPAVQVTIPWRRRDTRPERKAILIVPQGQSQEIANVARIDIEQERGILAFEPTTGVGVYEIYYLPHKHDDVWGGYNGDYIRPEKTADKQWLRAHGLSGRGLKKEAWQKLPKATVMAIEARSAFHSFYPMGVPANDTELAAFMKAHKDDYLVFPEDRRYPIRMRDQLPLRWVQTGPGNPFIGTAQRNEYYAFQLGVYAARKDVTNIQLEYTDLVHANGAILPADAFHCINLGGTNWDGQPLTKQVDVPKGKVQALWIGLMIPKDAASGDYTGSIEVQADNLAPQRVEVALTVDATLLEDHGDSERWRHSRLRWLDSTLGIDDDVVPPYTPLALDGQTLQCLGRDVTLNALGLPSSIRAGSEEVLRKDIALVLDTQDGPVSLTPTAHVWTEQVPGRVSWVARGKTSAVDVTCAATMEFDGHINFKLTVTAQEETAFTDLRLELPITPYASAYFMGAGRGGGTRPASYDWDWSGPYDSFWIGNVHAGVHCELRGGTYHGPMLNLYHPAPPETWFNGGQGGVRVRDDVDGGALVQAYTGPRTLAQGESITFEFALLVTPVKPLDTKKHFETRYYHAIYAPEVTEDVTSAGVNVINIHHGNYLNPYINYPFIEMDVLKEFIDEQHAGDRAVKIYNTIRELTNYVDEIFALRSLGEEVLTGGRGGGFPWLQEHLGTGYTPAWFSPLENGDADAAIVTAGLSRWCNYYVEGLQWLAENLGIDGLYLDDVSYDRSLLQRMRKALVHGNPNAMLDLHSNTGFSMGAVNQYAKFFPYIDRLWFGESFHYDAMSPDQWLVEVSGIPFGLMGNMLHRGGNQWLGPVFGMNTRLGWITDGVVCDPRNVWRVYDTFGIADSRMIGYWEADCPVKTRHPDVKATVYTKPGTALIALGNFGDEKVDCTLNIDWSALGLSPGTATLRAPETDSFQSERTFAADEAIPIMAKRGWLIIVK